ncbi:hypothetical protein LguiA_008060 [Lonicera macranthoides]
MTDTLVLIFAYTLSLYGIYMGMGCFCSTPFCLEMGQENSSSTCAYDAYDVFLSFRGEDTQKNFTDHLYIALVRARFHTFRENDEIGGERIKQPNNLSKQGGESKYELRGSSFGKSITENQEVQKVGLCAHYFALIEPSYCWE